MDWPLSRMREELRLYALQTIKLRTSTAWHKFVWSDGSKEREREVFLGNRKSKKISSKKRMTCRSSVRLSRSEAPMRSQHPLQLTPNAQHLVKHLVQAHRTPQAVARRAQLIETWHGHPDWSTKQFARALNRHENWVRKWRQRWLETHSLQDAPRSGAPRRFSSRRGGYSSLSERKKRAEI